MFVSVFSALLVNGYLEGYIAGRKLFAPAGSGTQDLTIEAKASAGSGHEAT